MKALKTPFLIGAAAIAAIGLAGAAVAEIKHSHIMQVRLPDGTLEEIRYAGDTRPAVRLQPSWAPVAYAWGEDAFGSESPVARLQRLSAQMERAATALLQQAHGPRAPMIDGPVDLTQVDLGQLPPGMSGYSVVSTVSGGGVCTRTVQYGPSGGSGRLTVVTRVSGDCDGANPSPSSPAASAPEARHQSMLQQVSARF